MTDHQITSAPAPEDDGYFAKLGVATAAGVGAGLALTAVGGLPVLGFVLAAKVTSSTLNALNKNNEAEVKK